MPYISISLIIQIALVIHAIRNGKQMFWIFLIIFVPLIGSVAYAVVELLPDLRDRHRSTLQRGASQLGEMVNPGGKIKELEKQNDLSPTVENMRALATAYLAADRAADALPLLEKSANSPLGPDSRSLSLLAEACFKLERPREALEHIRAAKESADRQDDPDNSLLEGRILEALGSNDEAAACFESASRRGSGLYYQFAYGDFLRRRGETSKAEEIFSKIEADYSRMPAYAKKLNRRWHQEAQKAQKGS